MAVECSCATFTPSGLLVAVTPLFWLGARADLACLGMCLPPIHLLTGVTEAAIDLCDSNIQLKLAPVDRPSKYFAIAAAGSGICGGLEQRALVSPA